MASARVDADELLWAELAGRGVRDLTDLSSPQLVTLASRYALWLPVGTYTGAPWLAPFAIRRLRNRTDPRAPGPRRDLWGMPDEHGYFADDNSLIKGVVKNLGASPGSPYHDDRIKKGLVCCHVWPATTGDPLLFSFVPNLVWLPRSLAPYSDAHLAGPPHEVHEVLKATSLQRYRSVQPRVGRERSEQAWARLAGTTATAAPQSHEFVAGPKVVSLASQRVRNMIDFLEATLDDTAPPPRKFSKRYHAGTGERIDQTVWPVQHAVSPEARRELITGLRACLASSAHKPRPVLSHTENASPQSGKPSSTKPIPVSTSAELPAPIADVPPGALERSGATNATEIIKEIRQRQHASWSNLQKAARELQGLHHEPFSTRNVESSSKSHVRLMMRETGLELKDVTALLQRLTPARPDNPR